MEYLSTKYGLVTDLDKKSENGQLFLATLILLQNLKGTDYTESSEVMKEQLENSKVKPGLYNRNPDLFDHRILSHDNLDGIFSYSKLLNTNHRFEIWRYLLLHFGTYDNSLGMTDQKSKYLPFNPSNFFIWGLCAESNIYLLFLPIYLISLIISCNKKPQDTSGKILSWVELLPHKNHWLVKYLFSYYERKMKKQYGEDYFKELMTIYHGNNSKEFPINKILGIGI